MLRYALCDLSDEHIESVFEVLVTATISRSLIISTKSLCSRRRPLKLRGDEAAFDLYLRTFVTTTI